MLPSRTESGEKHKWKRKRSEATQTLRAGYSKADPQTNTYKHTDMGDYNTLRGLARSVINLGRWSQLRLDFDSTRVRRACVSERERERERDLLNKHNKRCKWIQWHLCCRPLSVRHVRSCIVSRWLKISSNFFLGSLARHSSFWPPSTDARFQWELGLHRELQIHREWGNLRFSTEVGVYLGNGTK